MLDSDAESARTLVLVAIILQVVFVLIGVITIAFVITLVSRLGPITPTPGVSPGFNPANVIALVFGILFLVGIIWILLDYFLVYKPLGEERVGDTESASLVLSILQILFGGVIPGILMLIAYVKIKDSVRRRERTN